MSTQDPPPEQAPADFRYHAVIVPESGKLPYALACSSKEALFDELYSKLLSEERGFCFVYLDGVKADISFPQLSYQLKMPDGKVETVTSKNVTVFAPDNSFSTIVK